MKTILIATATALIVGFLNTASAGCVGPVVMGECLSGTSVPGRDSDNDRGYKSSSGQRYDYNLNNPADQSRYSTDLNAQRRDQIQGMTSSKRELDRKKGQYGGGIQRD